MKTGIELTLSKETKGTFVYSSSDDNTIIKSIYLTKSEMPTPAPKTVRITVEA